MSKFEQYGSIKFSPTAVTDKEEVHGLHKRAEGSGVCDWNNMINKPFGEQTTYSDTLTWDGQPTDISFELMGMNFFHISDVILSEEDLSKTVNITSSTGWTVAHTFVKTAENFYTVGEFICYTLVDNYPIGGISIPKAGMYTALIPDGTHVSELTIADFDKFPMTQIKTIDERYLPESIGSGGIALVEVTTGDDGFLTGSATFEEICQMICNGKQVYAIYGDCVYTLSGGITPSTIFNGISPMSARGANLGFSFFDFGILRSLDVGEANVWYYNEYQINQT